MPAARRQMSLSTELLFASRHVLIAGSAVPLFPVGQHCVSVTPRAAKSLSTYCRHAADVFESNALTRWHADAPNTSAVLKPDGGRFTSKFFSSDAWGAAPSKPLQSLSLVPRLARSRKV
jgi:hypothetical protein